MSKRRWKRGEDGSERVSTHQMDTPHPPTSWHLPPTPTTYLAPEPAVYEGYRLADEPPEIALMNEHEDHVVSFVDDNDDANIAPDHDIVIEQLAHELIASGETNRSWAEEVEDELGFALEGECMPANYSPPSPTPWFPPPPPTSFYTPPRLYYPPFHSWRRPTRTLNTS
jgi:hypothetical protein